MSCGVVYGCPQAAVGAVPTAPLVALRDAAAAAMDMLVDYSDDDDDDQPAPLSSSVAPMPSPTPMAAAPVPPLPSAAQLFDTPASSAASTSCLPRKRPQVNGSAHPSQQPKVARSTSSARPPLGSTLVPPQLRGRSNVATEDLDKLFVQRQQRRSE